MSGDFTRIGFLFWEWPPLRHLDPTALKLWLVIYTKSVIPGLWTGDIPDLSSQSFLSAEDTLKSLDRLLDADLIEFDRAARVLRLTKLPDEGEWPSAPGIMKSWWKTFSKKIPACQVRDAHVVTLRWLLEEGAKKSENNRSGKPSALHEQIWSETFGQVVVPSSRRRGVRSFGEADMGNAVQPSLFAPPSEPSGYHPEGSRSVLVPPPVDNYPDPTKSPSLGTTWVVQEKEKELERESSSGSGIGGGSGEGHATSKAPHLALVPLPPAFGIPELVERVWNRIGPRAPRMTDAIFALIAEAVLMAEPIAKDRAALDALADYRGEISPGDFYTAGRFTALVERALAKRRDSAAKSAALHEARELLGI